MQEATGTAGTTKKSHITTDLGKERELNLKEREIVAREREVNAKVTELNRSRWLNPTVIALFAASLGLLGNIVVARLNSQNSESAERLRLQSNLVLEAIKTGDPDKACTNLVFFVKLGLVDDSNNAIRGACGGTKENAPSLPGWKDVTNAITSTITGQVVDQTTKVRIEGAHVTVEGVGDAVTNRSGIFKLQLPPNMHSGDIIGITVEKSGYETNQSHLRLPGDWGYLYLPIKRR